MSRKKRRNGSISALSGSATKPAWRRILVGSAIGGLVVLGIVVITLKGRIGGVTPPFEQPPAGDTRAADEATFIGPQACASCHPRQDERWRGSHHDLAMQVANEKTVLGDFDSATFTNFGVTSSFYKRDGKFMVRTDGPDGALHDYEISYTFGVTPLQQYLIKFPDGRMQVLDIGWDSRPKEEGGQRWFHLHPDEKITADDILHWTGPYLNWNYMCAECHSTDLRKNFDLKTNTFQTTWSDINVSCEACHGPGSRHVKWAEAVGRGERHPDEAQKGLDVQLKDPQGGVWKLDPKSGVAKRSTPLTSNIQIETCARCHSRRSVVHDTYVHGRPLMDTHRPALLEEVLYHADGQILEEVYVYGSFLQSKMYHAGVTCSDCHDPHSLNVRATGSALCTRCHQPTKYDNPSHHFHKADSPGARCVECHMPAKTYMVVDPRRDHSLRDPRPDLSVKLGTPNACNRCHTDRPVEWAADAVAKWYGPGLSAEPHFGEALHGGRKGLPGAGKALVKLAGDRAKPNIARASALSLLRRYPSTATVRAIQLGLRNDDPLVRLAAARALEILEPPARLTLAYPLLSDPTRAVRIEAARVLAPVPSDMMTTEQRKVFDRGIAEYVESQRVNAERPGAHLNMGLLYTARGQFDQAETAYRTALRIDPKFVQGYLNLADLYRVQGRDPEGEPILRKALKISPDAATVHHALGLFLVRQERLPEAVKALGRAAKLAPDNAHFSYVYGVALNEVGKTKRALAVLKKAHERHPYDRELLLALVTINRDKGALDSAIQYAKKLLALSPQDQASRQLLEQLQSQRER
ncbi:MAG: tetratricopeptide repeat protein [Candidatus Methylomirabilales bacterium]|jgi:tetratricopeptide (TPR) repeat protein